MLTTGQKIALDTFLTEYDYKSDFETNIIKIKTDHPEISVCDMYEDIDQECLAKQIEQLAQSIDDDRAEFRKEVLNIFNDDCKKEDFSEEALVLLEAIHENLKGK